MQANLETVLGILGTESRKHSAQAEKEDADRETVMRALTRAIAVQNAAQAVCDEYGLNYQRVYLDYFQS